MASAENKREAGFSRPAQAAGTPSLLLQFGAFTLDLQRHGLYREDKRLHLTSRPFETLVVLVEHRGKTVEKQKLLDAVWKDSFVTEDSVVKAVREIRRALDDEKSSHEFIQTVPGEGYRFIAEVTPANPVIDYRPEAEQQVAEVKEPDMRPPQTIGMPAPARGLRLRYWALGAVLVLLATVAVAILWRPWPRSAPTQRLIFTVSASNTADRFSASNTAASFSPDGNWITFVNNDANSVPQVWVQNLAQGEPIQITSGDVPASHPRWSPRNDEIVFSRGENAQSIWSVPPLGGLAPTLLIERGRNPNWSSDGNRLVFEKREEIWTANADGTNEQRVDGVPQVEWLIVDREPSFSPDGFQIAFFQPEDGPMGDIWVIPSGGGQAKQLTFDNHWGGGLAWTPDGNSIVFSSQRGGSKTLWKIHRSGGMPEPVLNSPGEDTNPEISRDNTKLIYTSTRNHWILTLEDVASGQIQELRETRTDMFSPRFSPQGDKIAFFATVDGGDIHLFTVRVDGKELTQVTRSKGERNTFPAWSADGSILYFYQIRPTLSFRGISATGGTSFEIAPGWRPRSHSVAQVDPSGKRVVYSKVEKSNVVATLVREIESGTEMAFWRPLDTPRWSRDGKFILGVDWSSDAPANGFGDIVVCSVESGVCTRVATRGNNSIWSADNSRIYFDRWKSRDSRELWSVSSEGEDEKRIVERRQLASAGYDLSARDQLVYIQFRPGRQELWMMDFD